VILISPEGETVWQYAKFNRAPGMEQMMTIRGDGVLPVGIIPQGIVTGAVCYDMDFPAHIRQAGRMGSGLLIAPSNDWPEITHMHAAMARMRAIENGSSLLRPASSGISLAVDGRGRIRARVDDAESGGAPLTAVLPVHPVRTIYTALGDIWMWICAVGAAAFLLYGVLRSVNRGATTADGASG
jgi:apolipoprotein N-acyltransferase